MNDTDISSLVILVFWGAFSKNILRQINRYEINVSSFLLEWSAKEQYLQQVLQLQSFQREADQIDASSGAHEAVLEYQHCGVSDLAFDQIKNNFIQVDPMSSFESSIY